jgi:hypothetical protein
MGFSRALAPAIVPEPHALTSAMVGIGMGFAATPSPLEPNIEDTLLFASIEGIEKDDFRVLAILVTWFGVHRAWVNADRLTKLAGAAASPRVRALWSALARWQGKDRRFARLARVYRGPRIELLPVGTEFQIRRHGEDPRFERSAVRVPGNLLRDREQDVVAPADLARSHRAYRSRVTMGPGYRADLWAALEAEPGLSVAELARRTYSSFATAWAVRRDFEIVAGSRRPPRLAHRAS